MAWLTDWDNANNKIIDENTKFSAYVAHFTPTGETPVQKLRVTHLIKYRRVGLTYEAAQDCQDALHDPPDVQASIHLAGNPEEYYVSVVEYSETIETV